MGIYNYTKCKNYTYKDKKYWFTRPLIQDGVSLK